VPAGVEVYAIDGPFFFGAAEKFRETLGQVGRRPKVLIIQMERVPAIDSTGIHALRDVVRRTLRDGTLVILAGVHAQPMVALGRSPLLDEVGEENIFIFGLEAHEVAALMAEGYDPQRWLAEHRWMRRAVDTIAAGHFSRGDKDIFRPIVAKLLSTRDEYVHLADLPAYVEAQKHVDAAYTDRNAWLRKSLLNIARMGKFSSDRTIAEYARDIWEIKPAVIGNFAHPLE
jgi:anti-anti-sigma regulatory factor